MSMEYKNYLDFKGSEKDIGSILNLILEKFNGEYRINFKKLMKTNPVDYEFVYIPYPVLIKKTHNKYMFEKKQVISDRENSLNKCQVPDIYC